MFNLNEFVMKTIKGMIGNYPDFQVTEYALNWYTRNVLTESDLAEINDLIDEKNAPKEPEIDETVSDIEDIDAEASEPQEEVDGEETSKDVIE